MFRVQKPDTTQGFKFLVKHRQPVTSVALSEDDRRGFSASKDGTIVHWDVESGKSEKYLWPSGEVLKSHGVKDAQGRATKHSKQVLSLAVSSDGRYLASGGLDRHVHLWDVRTRQHIQVCVVLQLLRYISVVLFFSYKIIENRLNFENLAPTLSNL